MKYICSEVTAVCSVSQVLMCCIFVIPCIKLEDVSSADVTEGHYYCYIVCVSTYKRKSFLCRFAVTLYDR